MALQTGKGVPFEYLVLQLAREFHCMPEQIEKQPREKMELLLDIMGIEGQFQNRKGISEQKKFKPRHA